MNVRSCWDLIKETIAQWNKEHTGLLAAGLSYFTMFSMAPILLIAIAVCGFYFGEAAAAGQIVGRLRGFVNEDFARVLESFIHNAHRSGLHAATFFGAAVLLFTASGLFFHLRRALNLVWNVNARGGMRRAMLDRLFSFLMVLGVGVFLLLFFIVDAVLGTMRNTLGHLLPVLAFVPLWKAANFALSFGAFTLFITLIYKLLPAMRIPWRDALLGAAVTALLLSVGTTLMGLYFSYINFKSVYGVAASLAITFFWVYFSALFFLLGAKFTWVYTHRLGGLRKTK